MSTTESPIRTSACPIRPSTPIRLSSAPPCARSPLPRTQAASRTPSAELSITQISKHIAAPEKDLDVRLFTRTARVTIDGQALLPNARALLQAEERAIASVAPGRRALRVDVIGRRLAPAGLLRDFHRAYPAIPLDVVPLFDADAALDVIASDTIDASFRALTAPDRLPAALDSTRILDEPVQLVIGPAHPFAAARAVRPAEHRIWMPGTVWAAFYDDLATAFGLTIAPVGPTSAWSHSSTQSPTPPR
ncbi:LysR family transcriptional regulator [Actinomadura nitritigenes]|uniref:LysR family transcriptional regulator n=1 Tax=Actinomadura nitritigenes TaxID=134602 RepID=UPI0036D08C0E